MGDPCRTTRHCADHGWCHRCDPALSALMSEINHLIQTTVADSEAWGHLYAEIARILHTGDPARMAAELAETRKTVQALNRRAQAAESLAERYSKAVRDWRVDEDGTYVPYESLKKIGKLAGVEILPHVRYMQRFENAQRAEEFLERIYGLLEHPLGALRAAAVVVVGGAQGRTVGRSRRTGFAGRPGQPARPGAVRSRRGWSESDGGGAQARHQHQAHESDAHRAGRAHPDVG